MSYASSRSSTSAEWWILALSITRQALFVGDNFKIASVKKAMKSSALTPSFVVFFINQWWTGSVDGHDHRKWWTRNMPATPFCLFTYLEISIVLVEVTSKCTSSMKINRFGSNVQTSYSYLKMRLICLSERRIFTSSMSFFRIVDKNCVGC